MTDRRPPSTVTVVLAAALAAAGMIAHNVLEFGPAFVANAETLIPLAIFIVLALAVRAAPSSVVVNVALLAWALLHLVGGGILSALPLDIFPFQPEQSVGHYVSHAIYTATQVPLIVVAALALRRRRPTTAASP
jgi:hypothetical protein